MGLPPSTLGRVGWVNSECLEVERREARAGWGPITIVGGSQGVMCSGWVTPKDRTHTTLCGDRPFQGRKR